MSLDYEYFKEKMLELTGFDLHGYKEKQIRRRLGTLMKSLGAEDFRAYYQILKREPQHLKRFFQRATINVSEFFRNPQRFQELQEVHLPQLLARQGCPRVWSAGASTGEEAYTLAIIFSELGLRCARGILATDVDEEALQFARQGIYPPGRLRHLPPGYLPKYFRAVGENHQVIDQVKSLVSFKRHDLLRDPFPSGFDLILCRNVVIYFTQEAKEKIYRGLAQALNPGGIIFTGATEQIFGSRDLDLVNLSPFFYQKK
ncbi:MAG: protein-glutamate O-methyltransferase CheR [Firmicutes bacterium]|nr:protein-glutamate O-methyltransferase CheR [Bacillota bacterium]